MTDRIKVLVIEDRPSKLAAVPGGPPIVPAPLNKWFDVRWLATPGEAREFRELSIRAGRSKPQALGTDGWVPEILVVDYALRVDNENWVAQQSAAQLRRVYWAGSHGDVSPLPALRRIVGMSAECATAELSHLQNDVATAPGSDLRDVSGCTVGALVAAAFSDHPCAMLAHTVHTEASIGGTHADLTQWMLEKETGDLFKATQKYDGWEPLLKAGVGHLRDRIIALVEAAVIVVSLHDIFEIYHGRRTGMLRLWSRYGGRQLPVPALFLDVEQPNNDRGREPDHDVMVTDPYETFASDLVSALLKQAAAVSIRTIERAEQLARELWESYDDKDWFAERIELSELVAELQSNMARPVSIAETALLKLYGLTAASARESKPCGDTARVRDVGNWGDFSAMERRLATLNIIVKLHHRRFSAINTTAEAEERGLSQVIEKAIESSDVLLALYASPKTPVVVPWAQGQNPDVSDWKHLQRWHDSSINNGQKYNLALSIQDVLDGHSWEHGAGAKPFRGLFEWERGLMRWWATDEYGGNGAQWTKDANLTRIIKGDDGGVNG